jgi:hypothetical protein
MKKIITILAAILINSVYYDAFSQTYNGAFYEMFFGRQPGARAEGMGRGMASVTGDATSYFYNPAGTGSLKGLNLNAGFGGPYYSLRNYKLDSAYYDYFGASYNYKKYGTIGFSYDYFSYGFNYKINRTDEYGNIIGTYTYDPEIAIYRLTYSLEVIKDLFVGTNLNLLHPDLIQQQGTSVGNETSYEDKDVFYFDLGAIKSFNINSGKLNHNINIGSSLINLNSAEYSIGDASQAEKLPVIFRLGAAYDLSADDRSIVSNLKSYNFLVNAEYEDLFNSAYFGGFHGGIEFTFLEILSLRAGYYSQNAAERFAITDTNGVVTGQVYEEKTVNEFTYGFGLNIPVSQMTKGKTPVEIKFDYANLKQPSYVKDEGSPGNYYVYTILLKWIF